MPVGTKRKRTAPNGLSAGERLKRDKLAGPELYSQWGWISSVDEPSQITLEHRRAACGFYDKTVKPICPNKHRDSTGRVYKKQKVDVAHDVPEGIKPNPVDGEDADDVIVISSEDEGPHVCSKKQCKDNPQCVNYLGQTTLEKDSALQSFLDAANLGPSPLNDAREPDLPIGLKNLGATCYANAFIQVWFQDRAFRDGVYRCKPSQEEGSNLEDSPIFQLQITFAALQEITQNVFNPVKLVESLQLRASEQQDAQEFSKLFMSHLATEFEKQEVPSLKTLLSDQFEGKQTYGTMCRSCGHRSEQQSDFLELEINLENNGKLEERIDALLQSEELSGDNKYYCTQCDGLQDATRYTKLQRLPPVLHISILRFVFDLSSLSRKKSKQCILFPPVLDMSAYMAEQDGGSSESRLPSKRTHEELEDENGSSGLVYELRGILLHKGPSAYHGHYEAQVLDSNTKQFYQFNDETVTPITPLQSKKGLSNIDKDTGDVSVSAAANKKRRTYSRKKARVEDSEGEPDKRPDVSEEARSYISSRDAYMLIYARRDKLTPDQVPEPPLSAKEKVEKLNDAYDRTCASYLEREKTLTNEFNRMRESKKSIYSHWETTDQREESAVVSRAALEAWIKKDLENLKKKDSREAASSNHPKERSPGERHSLSRSDSPCDPLDLFAPTPILDIHQLDNSEIVCLHGRLDPRKANEMKRITNSAVTDIRVETDCFFEPELSTRDVCEYCVQALFLEKRYGLDHPKHVAQFEEFCESDCDSQGAWISKRWLADWRQTKPKMHINGKEDPPPDASDYFGHVRCVHDRLSLVSTSRKRINGEACAFLQGLFPTWRPLPDDAQECEACGRELNLSKETKQEFKKQAEDEKSKLRNLYSSHSLGVEPEVIAGVTQAIVPTDFLRQWRMWLGRPHEKPRPGPIDNSWLLCDHDRLIIDPNVSKDFGTAISLVFLSDWEKLQEIYGGGPLISVTGAVQAGDEIEPTSVTHDFEVCEACRKERNISLSNLDAATVTVRILGDDDPNPTADCHEGKKFSSSTQTNEVNGTMASEPRRERPTRTSTRLRKSKRTARRREIKITKLTTLKDIKIELHDDLDIPTICQRLFYNGLELMDNSQTLASLGVMANDTLYLREEKEQDDALNSDAEPEPVVRREEGRAFGGTVLGGYTRKATTPATDDDTERQSSPENACPACTFINPDGLSECSICGSPLSI